MKRVVKIVEESWPSLIPFRISGHTWHDFPCVVCEIEDDGIVGRGEALGVYYLGETTASMLAQLQSIAGPLADGAGCNDLLELLPAGGARFAADSALWDLQAKLGGSDAWQLAGTTAKPVETVFTIGLEDTPEEMAARATAAADLSLFKVKLGNDRPVERIAAIREARPDARLIVDINQGWTFADLKNYGPQIADLGVQMIEQPLPRGDDHALRDYRMSVPLCADESCLNLDELDAVSDGYQMINIKLDKTGGLTHALQLADAAEERGLELMVGCMGGTSLSMAPSHVIAQRCTFVDIDGPLLIGKDRQDGLIYENGWVARAAPSLWGC